MKTSILSSFIFTFVLVASGLAEKPKGCMYGSDYDLEQKFVPSELRRLAKLEKRDFVQNRLLWQMIVHAGLENDSSFRALIGNKELRGSNSSVDLAISAYHYMLDVDEKALDHILAFLETERVGADTDTIIVLSAIDEWDRSVRAFKKHFYVIDGAGGENYRGFFNVRSFLYPKKYAKHKEEVEANPRH